MDQGEGQGLQLYLWYVISWLSDGCTRYGFLQPFFLCHKLLFFYKVSMPCLALAISGALEERSWWKVSVPEASVPPQPKVAAQ